MELFYKHSAPGEGEAMLRANVTAMRANSFDLKLANGSSVMGCSVPLYDENGNEIPLETIRRNFAVNDLSALKARIEELEKLIAGMEV